ncbi:MAG: SAVED domain-containing protein [Candidatus Acididesulfobacter diazotrophicus]|jgi:hypothetical protein|uniref:SAVED domain-containing protein n=1 Tax=Candidatus Acididesulfobacter diazotrophicus TaxID=2597226 RepID=A0A519BLF6_9DELT|nr:MAG: SAVED domain-containing protein [Candidatus Acididesulfobacter diazotrophicus]
MSSSISIISNFENFKDFIEILVENKYLQWATTLFVVLSTIGAAIHNEYIFWISLILFAAGLFIAIYQQYRKLNIYNRDFIPIPVVINISNPADSNNALTSMFSFIEKEYKHEYKHHKENLEQIYHIKEDELIFEFKGKIEDKESLKDYLKITKHDIEKLEKKIPAKDKFYIIYIGPVSVAILIGAIFVNSSVVIFQYNKSSNGYNKVAEINDRNIKENVSNFEKFDIEKMSYNNVNNLENINYNITNDRNNDNNSDSLVKSNKVTLAIDISSHKINLNQQDIKEYGDIIYLKSKNSIGTLSRDEDWIEYVREIFKELNILQREYNEIKLIYSMPVSLGLMLGIAIHNYWKIMLTQYEIENGSYTNLMFTNEINYRY